MTLCNHCGAEVHESRYGRTPSLCSDCEQGVEEMYRADRPADDMDEPLLDPGCAWCAMAAGTPPGERGSTGICARHRQQLIAQAFADRAADRQGKREEQVVFSAAVLMVGLALGVLVGAWLAFLK